MFRRKKQEAKWAMEDIFMEDIEEFKQNKVFLTEEERRARLQELLDLDERKLEFEKEHKVVKDKVSKNHLLSVAAVLILGAAPYLLEKNGLLAKHFPKMLQSPKLFK